MMMMIMIMMAVKTCVLAYYLRPFSSHNDVAGRLSTSCRVAYVVARVAAAGRHVVGYGWLSRVSHSGRADGETHAAVSAAAAVGLPRRCCSGRLSVISAWLVVVVCNWKRRCGGGGWLRQRTDAQTRESVANFSAGRSVGRWRRNHAPA